LNADKAECARATGEAYKINCEQYERPTQNIAKTLTVLFTLPKWLQGLQQPCHAWPS